MPYAPGPGTVVVGLSVLPLPARTALGPPRPLFEWPKVEVAAWFRYMVGATSGAADLFGAPLAVLPSRAVLPIVPVVAWSSTQSKDTNRG